MAAQALEREMAAAGRYVQKGADGSMIWTDSISREKATYRLIKNAGETFVDGAKRGAAYAATDAVFNKAVENSYNETVGKVFASVNDDVLNKAEEAKGLKNQPEAEATGKRLDRNLAKNLKEAKGNACNKKKSSPEPALKEVKTRRRELILLFE